jgi:transcriptional regulator with XRE-family HTH domain
MGLTQENVSETFNVSNVTIHRWETGKAPMSTENFFRLAELYGVSPGQLMFAPANEEAAKALEDAWRVISILTPEERKNWLSVGQNLSELRSNRRREDPDETVK